MKRLADSGERAVQISPQDGRAVGRVNSLQQPIRSVQWHNNAAGSQSQGHIPAVGAAVAT